MIVGAGPVGIVTAEYAARSLGWRSLIIDKREHIAGNCFDSKAENGVMIHNYGPHYFRTDNERVMDYLNSFTEWIDGDYVVKSEVAGELYPFPINLETLEKFFDQPLDTEKAKELLASLREEISAPQNSEEFVLSRVGRSLYEAFYKGYTKKMWGLEATALDPSVCGRIPIKLNRDPYYVDKKYRKFPKEGYTAMFSAMLDHPLIDVRLTTDFFAVRDQIGYSKALIYTGPIDRYFDHCYGKLSWRSLRFEFEQFDKSFAQPCVQINYPDERPFTRKVEIKHVTKQQHPQTVVCTEYPQAKGEPYYPVPNPDNRSLYLRYKALADKEKDVYFVGRLAEYTYINMDEAILKGLELVDRLKECH